MEDEFDKDKKIELTDGNTILCTNKVNPKLEMRQLTPIDITFFKSIDALFQVTELTVFEAVET